MAKKAGVAELGTKTFCRNYDPNLEHGDQNESSALDCLSQSRFSKQFTPVRAASL